MRKRVVMIEVKNLSKSYGSKLAVDKISFTANDGVRERITTRRRC